MRERAKHLILDATGIALASGRYDFAHKAATAISGLGGEGRVPVIGLPLRLPPRDAALLNGILVHGLDFDDTHTGGVIHATASLWPAVLAAAHMRGASGADLVTAYVAGVEAATRLAAVGSGPFHQLGFHPTGLIGVFGCTLAAGTLMGLSPQALVMAQGIALSMAAGSLEFLEDGAWTKRMHPGWAAQSGITAAALAQQGFVGPSRAYEGRFGLFNAYLQAGIEAERWGRATAGLGEVWETMAVAVKPLPACHFTHACSDAAIALARAAQVRDRRHRAHQGAGAGRGGQDRVRAGRQQAPARQRLRRAVLDPLSRGGEPGARPLRRSPSSSPRCSADERILRLCDLVDYEVDPRSTFPRHYTGEVQISLQGRPHAGAPRGHEPRLRRPAAVECRDRREVRPATRACASRRARPTRCARRCSGSTRRPTHAPAIDRICQAAPR